MKSLTILPPREELAHVFNNISQDESERKVIFVDLGKRVIEHSDEVKRLNPFLMERENL